MNPIIVPQSRLYKPIDRAVAMASHSIVIARAVDDPWTNWLNSYLQQGYREVVWEYGFEKWQDSKLWEEMGSVCPACFALDGQHFKIEWLLANKRHDAPLYSLSHVNCSCKLKPVARQDEQLDFTGAAVDVAPFGEGTGGDSAPLDLSEAPTAPSEEPAPAPIEEPAAEAPAAPTPEQPAEQEPESRLYFNPETGEVGPRKMRINPDTGEVEKVEDQS